jgi:hypothetical protein
MSWSPLNNERIAVVDPGSGSTVTSSPSSAKKPFCSANCTPTVVMKYEAVGSA